MLARGYEGYCCYFCFFFFSHYRIVQIFFTTSLQKKQSNLDDLKTAAKMTEEMDVLERAEVLSKRWEELMSYLQVRVRLSTNYNDFHKKAQQVGVVVLLVLLFYLCCCLVCVFVSLVFLLLFFDFFVF